MEEEEKRDGLSLGVEVIEWLNERTVFEELSFILFY